MKKYIFIILLFSIINNTYAVQISPNLESTNMLICQDNGTNLDFCSVQQDPIYADMNTEMAFQIHYNYSCIGHELFLAFQTDEGNATIPFPKSFNQDIKTIQISGKNLKIVSTSEKTSSALLSERCSLTINSIDMDISDISKATVENSIHELKLLNQVLSSNKNSVTLASSLASLIQTVDIPTLQTLLPNLKNDIQSIEDNLNPIQDTQDKTTISNAFDDIKTDIDNYIALNPSLASDPSQKSSLESQISTILQNLNQESIQTAYTISNLISEKYTNASKVLTFAKKETIEKYQPQLEALLNQSKNLT